ncbi:MAG TPA: protein-export chaperone SecB [Casimicrobiaceae bacterium]|jgi:preprotein translocase subunit SecB|nr:protein-export chaperone SecB [Casimicrobiaceae bacterium]
MADNLPPAQAQDVPQMSIEKIYVKDLSIENPGAPQSFRMTESPQIEVGLRTTSEAVDAGGVYETVLTMTVTARSGGKTVFLVEASQAGVFTLRGINEQQIGLVLSTQCPAVLFPYVRETIADATQRMGFPPIHLAPINFEALYAQQQQQAPAVAAG